MKNILRIISTSLILLSTTACVETVIIGSAATGTLVVMEKSFSATRQDISIATTLGVDFIENGLKNPGDSIDITVNEGRVLLTGIARNPDKANLAAELAWKAKGTKEVIDEIQISDHSNIKFKDVSKAFSDYLITLEVESKLLFGKKISSINYKVTTVRKIVYIIGTANDDNEMKNVVSIASRVRGVEKVVNHIVLSDDARRNG